MQKILLKNKKLRSKILKFIKKNPEVIDVILFGSAVRGKIEPKDIDVLLLFKDKINLDIEYQLRKIFESLSLKCEVASRTYKNLFDPLFLAKEGILAHGYSFLHNKRIAEGFGYTSLELFKYSLKNKSKSDRMRFYYALHGRNTEGILTKLQGIKFANSVVLVPIKNSEKFKEFLQTWKLEFDQIPILKPQKVSKFT